MTFAPPTIDTSWTAIKMPVNPPRRNLVIVRSGAKSLHGEWLNDLGSRDRNWDLLLSHYGENDADIGFCDIAVRQGGFKYPSCGRLYTDLPYLKDYAAVWLCDDDIMTSWATVNRIFDTFHFYNLSLAQPALTKHSFFSHEICVQHPSYQLRFTNFVEIMAPLFSQSALERCVHSFSNAVTGWGLDWAWPHLLGNPVNKVAILDGAPVTHTRAVSKGEIYRDAKRAGGGDAFAEHRHNIETHGVTGLPLVYGFISREPIDFNWRKLKPIVPSQRVLLDQIIRCVSSPPIVSEDSITAAHERCREIDWTSSTTPNAVSFPVSGLSSGDLGMSVNLRLVLQPIQGIGVEVLQIGPSKQQARLILWADADGHEKVRLTICLPAADREPLHFSVPSQKLAPGFQLSLHIIPTIGLIRVFVNGVVVEEGFLLPWVWRSADCAWLGSKRLKGSVQLGCLSPVLNSLNISQQEGSSA